MFAVEGKSETALLLFQSDMTLFNCLLQSCYRLKYGLNALTHIEKKVTSVNPVISHEDFVLLCMHSSHRQEL